VHEALSDTFGAHFHFVVVLSRMFWVAVLKSKILDGIIRNRFSTLHREVVVHNAIHRLILLRAEAEAANSLLVSHRLYMVDLANRDHPDTHVEHTTRKEN
jgi:hypothetical protein